MSIPIPSLLKPTMSSGLNFTLFLSLLISFWTCVPYAIARSSTSDGTMQMGDDEYLNLKVPLNVFTGSLESTIDIIRDVTSTLSGFNNFFGDFRLSNAVSDCLDLLDFSTDELSWSASASQNPNGSKKHSTGDIVSDVKTWLSAAVVNQDTCIDGFGDGSYTVKTLVAGPLSEITSSVQELLRNVGSKPKFNSEDFNHNTNRKNGHFPRWFKHEDRKLLLVDGVLNPDVVVAADGTGDFTSITDAVAAAPNYSMKRFVIYIKKGVYKENVEIKKKKWNLMMVGDGMGATTITGNRNYVDGWTTFRSATFAANGRGFLARDITFENTAGPEKHQAVALRSDSDLSVFYRCEFKGYQDTLYPHSMRQFYRECRISGTVDFIFGDATAIFQNCQILAKKGLPSQKNTVTAHGRIDPAQTTGFSIQFSNISADIDLLPNVNSTYTYLGRPWKNYSRTVFMESYMSHILRPEGWLEWNGNMHLDTLYYGEYMNYGPGAELGNRVKWPGFHILNDSTQADKYSVAQFIKGDLWLPSTGVKYTSGLNV